ncbi:hypothetical protein AB205_0008360 [Aquarana catesbeiana]|uniref:Uncharacterized protein n=1 Tax=Aquarana catesbeiana TaxID=8400 RepID=A0A2G9R9Z4_AQUCT|nr:hypothetical protein AB205_0008360 [Aquarana catesbeiana]
MHTVCQHVLSAITGDQCMRFRGCNPFLNNKVAERKGLHPQKTSIDPP